MIARLRGRLWPGRRDRAALAVLALVLALGAALRLAFMLAQRPGFFGYSDSQTYLEGAWQRLFADPLRPSGYPLFLRVVRQVNGDFSFTILVQHGLGLATAALLYLAARRAGAGRGWAVLPAAVVALGGTGLFLEHAALSEGLFAFVQAAALYAALRAGDPSARAWAWAAGAGLLAGYALTVRTFGAALVPLVAVWLLWAGWTGAAGRRRWLPALAALAGAAAVVGGYVLVQERATGFVGYTQAGSWNVYGRAAIFADCSAFRPPPGTRRLCERRPPSRRDGANSYIFGIGYSPAIRAFGTPALDRPAADAKLGAFARAAFSHQPLDWLGTVAREELPRYWDPERSFRPGQGLSTRRLVESLERPGPGSIAPLQRYWSTSGGFARPLLGDLEAYEEAVRVEGLLLAVLAALALLAPLAARRRRGAVLLTLTAAAALLGPPLFLYYDARYAVPAFGPLAAAAAVGGSALAGRVGARRARSRKAEP